MASPFAMMSMLKRARLAASKRLSSDPTPTPPASESTPTLPSSPVPPSESDTTSDTASIISTSDLKPKKRKSTLLGLGRKSSASSIAETASLAEVDTTASETASISSTSDSKKRRPTLLGLARKGSKASVSTTAAPAAAAASLPPSNSSGFFSSIKAIDAQSISSASVASEAPLRPRALVAAPQTLTEEPKGILEVGELATRPSSDGFSVVQQEEREKVQGPELEPVPRPLSTGSGEGDWTEVAAPLLPPPVSTDRKVTAPVKFADSVEGTPTAVSTQVQELLEEVSEAKKKEQGLIEKLEAQDAEKKRLEEEIRDLALEKGKLADEVEVEKAEKAQLAQEMRQLKDEWVNERARMTKDRSEEKERLQREKEVLRSRLVILEVGVEGGEQVRKRLEADVNALKKEKGDMSQIIVSLQLQLGSTQDQVAKTKNLVTVTEKREAALEEVLRNLREERKAALASKESQIQLMAATLEEAKKDLDNARRSAEEASRERDATVAGLEEKLAECARQDTQHEKVLEDQRKRQASDIRFRDPERGGSFTSKAPIEPVDAARNVLYSLNSEIFQAAAFFADSVEMHVKVEEGGTLESVEALITKLSPILSRDFVLTLRSGYTEPLDVPNPLLLQVALQACMSYCCNRFVTSWYPFHWDHGDFLQILHGRIVETGKSQVANTWKATTKALLRLTSESHPQFMAYLREHLVDVLAVIGRPVSNPEMEALMDGFEEKLSVIARLAIRMNILFNDAPSNLETFIAQPGEVYRAKMMEDTYADEDGDSSDSTDAFNANLKKVICTSDIGLQRLTSNGPVADTVVIKPKVVLATLLSQDW